MLVCGSRGNIFLDVFADPTSLVTVIFAAVPGHPRTCGCDVVLGEGLEGKQFTFKVNQNNQFLKQRTFMNIYASY